MISLNEGQAKNSTAEKAAQKLIGDSPESSRETLTKALKRWHELSKSETKALQAEGYSPSEAAETIMSKFIRAPSQHSAADSSSPEFRLVERASMGTLDHDGVRRILRIRKEVSLLRAQGMDTAQIIHELTSRLEKPTGYKRTGRTKSASQPSRSSDIDPKAPSDLIDYCPPSKKHHPL